jgi:hypothetical protein
MIKNSLIILLLISLSTGGWLANRIIQNLNQAMVMLQLKHKQEIARTKIKERGKRLLAALPVAGIIAASWFEKREYDEWKAEHPQGTPEQYAQEVSALVIDMSRRFYQELKADYPSLEEASSVLFDSPQGGDKPAN